MKGLDKRIDQILSRENVGGSCNRVRVLVKQAVQEALFLAIKEVEMLPEDQLVHTLDEEGDLAIGVKREDVIAILTNLQEKGGE